MPTDRKRSERIVIRSCLSLAMLAGCGGGPSQRELNNARAFEALLTAVSLQNERELERDAETIEQRHASGQLSDGNYQSLLEVISRARARDWSSAEKAAYHFRAQFGDGGAYFP